MLAPLKSIIFHKCPRCIEGEVFPDRNPYHLKQTAIMYPRCPECNLNYIPEPGFFYGAMYVSYAFTIAMGVGVFIVHYLLHGTLEPWWYILQLTIILLIAAPYTFRTSRLIWMNFFIRYDAATQESVRERKRTNVLKKPSL